ncbi:hypothetical protein V9T40_014926 [Parthenolecanium corni]|uniref:Uncharacterized protein n=1 Tax=Parthenolecanium corni TaxID=536013 RepID=A0AAN9TJM5_9HEMI
MLFVAGLILLAIFWTDIVNSKFASEYIQEMIIAEESRLSSAERSQLYEKIKEIIKQFGLLAIVALGAFLLVLEIYVTIATYSLYFKMNEPPPRHDYPPEEPEIISVETKKRRSQLRPHSFLEVKPIMKIN